MESLLGCTRLENGVCDGAKTVRGDVYLRGSHGPKWNHHLGGASQGRIAGKDKIRRLKTLDTIIVLVLLSKLLLA